MNEQLKNAKKFLDENTKKARQEKTKKLAKRMMLTAFPNSSLGFLSGHSETFDRFIKLAKELEKEMK